LASVGGVAGLKTLPGVAQTTAGKQGRILAVDDSLLLSFGPRTPDLILQMAAAVDELMK
jgi:iron complex transport system substrate-binding protein